MPAFLNDLGNYIARLLWANPILVRVVSSGSRRQRHFYIRLGYLAILFGITLMVAITYSGGAGDSLGDQAKTSAQAFRLVAMVQLAMMCLIAPVFAAGAITQERDNETYNILLTTPMSNAQIVVGSLFSRMYFIFALLVASIPIFSLTLLYGGTTTQQVLDQTILSGATALLFGSFAISVAVIGVGTRRTIFTFYMLIAMYLLSVGALGGLFGFSFELFQEPTAPLSPDPTIERSMSWLAPFHPFLALQVVLGQTPAPLYEQVAGYAWPWPMLLAFPFQSYVVLCLVVSVLVIAACIGFVRRKEMEGEQTLFNRAGDILLFWRNRNSTRPPKMVWDNPVAWREAKTRASLGGTGLLRGMLIGGGAIGGGALLYALLTGDTRPSSLETIRDGLIVIVMIELALILLMAANTSASALTREYESKSLETTISTPITPRYIIGGKIMGLIYFSVPLVLVPVLTVAAFGIVGVAMPEYAIVPPLSFVLVGLVLAAFAALTCVVGMSISLNNTRTVSAVMKTVAMLVVGHAILGFCGWSMLESDLGGPLLSQISPFAAVLLLLNPGAMAGNQPTDVGQIMVLMSFGAVAVTLVAAVVTYQMYLSMAKTFDQIIRTKISEAG